MPHHAVANAGTVAPVAVVEAEGVVKRFGTVTALAGATATVESGITGLVGANGAGKTTLLGLLLGLSSPDTGTLRVLGRDPVHDGVALRAHIGYAPEHRQLPPDTRAADLVAHLAEIHGLPRRAAVGRANDALWQVGLGEERFRAVGTMSTGQVQRVKLAAALVHDPELLLLDEPTDGLDPVQRDEMLSLIRRVGTEFGIDVVVSSHLLEEVERVCDHIVILGDGQVLAAGRLDDLRSRACGLVVELDAGTDVVAASLRAAGLTVEVDGHRLVVDPPDATFVCDVVARAGVGLVRLHPRRLSLEDVFLEAGMYGRPTGTAGS